MAELASTSPVAIMNGTGILAEHDFDPVSDAVVSWTIGPGTSVTQSATVPAGAPIATVHIRLRRLGDAGPVRWLLGSGVGAGDLATGSLPADAVNPWFEQWCVAQLNTTVVAPSSTVHLSVVLPAGSPGAYEWYGTIGAAVERPEVLARYRYTPTFGPDIGRCESVENPANVDYGSVTPLYRCGQVHDADGDAVPGISLGFAIAGPRATGPLGEEPFAWIRDITGNLHTTLIRDAGVVATTDEVTIDDSWRLVADVAGPAARTTIAEFTEFLGVAMGVELDEKATQTITVTDSAQQLPGREAFTVHVARHAILVEAGGDRGAMRGLLHLEAEMTRRRAPIVAVGRISRQPRFSPRITCAPFGAKTELTAPIDPYTDGLLGRIARGGFDAIWMWGDLDSIGRSTVYPELDTGVEQRQAKLNEVVERAARHGIDVYLYLANRPLPEPFFARHPGARGSAFVAYDGVNVACTSTPEVREHLRSAALDLGHAVPGIGGAICNVGGEGLLHCHTRDLTCRHCAERPAHEVVAELCHTVRDGLREAVPDAVVAVWPYSATNWWSAGDPTQSKLMDALDGDITWLTEFAKEAPVTHGETTIPAFDYPVSVLGPSPRFQRQAAAAEQRGLDLWVKTEHAIALELIQTPYIPAMFRWAERLARLGEQGNASGLLANWMHYGFMPTPATELFAAAASTEPRDAVTMLRRIAVDRFGEPATDHVLDAWRRFSEAIGEYPFSGPVASGVIQKGPAHPLFLDPDYRPAHGAVRQFCNDLSWTEPWGPEVTIEQLARMERGWAAGVAALQQGAISADGDAHRAEASRELGIATALLACVRSAINVARFYLVRDRLATATTGAEIDAALDELVDIAVLEIDNARSALPHVRADSRLGYANSGSNDQVGVPRAGIYTARCIEKKIAQVARVVDEEIPAYRLQHVSRIR